MTILKTIVWTAILFGAFTLWKRHEWYAAKRANQSDFGGSTAVIVYTDPNDLLAQLKRVKVGQKIETRLSESASKYVHTGIACSDEAAKSAYRAKAQQEMDRINRGLEIEMKRINRIP